MANRVILGELPEGGAGFRVSKPGVNVLTVEDIGQNVSFDSRWSASSRIVVSGLVTVPASSTVITVNYGETLPSLPVVIASGRDRTLSTRWWPVEYWGNANDFITYGDGQSTTLTQRNQFYNLEGYNEPPAVRVFDNRVQFVSRAPYTLDRISYVVLRP